MKHKICSIEGCGCTTKLIRITLCTKHYKRHLYQNDENYRRKAKQRSLKIWLKNREEIKRKLLDIIVK